MGHSDIGRAGKLSKTAYHLAGPFDTGSCQDESRFYAFMARFLRTFRPSGRVFHCHRSVVREAAPTPTHRVASECDSALNSEGADLFGLPRGILSLASVTSLLRVLTCQSNRT